jgi:predicted nuclease with TOPRIM domain
LVSEPDVRLAIINAVLRDVATKGDIEALKAATRSDIESLRTATKSDVEALRKEFKEGIEALREELRSDVEYLRRGVSELRERVSKLEGAFTQLVDRMGDLDKRIDYTTKSPRPLRSQCWRPSRFN